MAQIRQMFMRLSAVYLSGLLRSQRRCNTGISELFCSGTLENIFYKKENGKYQLNLWEANKIIFMEAGITENHISMPGICTCCNPEFLFSHRASHGKRGNLGAFLGLK